MRRYAALAILVLSFTASCAAPPKAPSTSAEALVKLSASEYPDLTDGGDTASLAASVSRSIEYLSKLPPDRTFAFGRDSYTASELCAPLSKLHYFLTAGPAPDELSAYVRENFAVYAAPGFDGYGTSMFTGYYTPELAASRYAGEGFSVPLYALPDDLVSAELAGFGETCAGGLIRGRVKDARLVPYYTRAEIDGFGALSGRGLELAWCADPVEVFFLHVQGSGVLAFDDGTRLHANYAGQNGRPYRSIGKLMVDEGRAKLDDMSLDWLYRYLHARPEEVGRVLCYNESYVFFRLEADGPFGSLGVPVTPGRSVATDKAFFPEGALGFVVTETPSIGPDGAVVGWGPYGRFVLNQDAGGAIKGPGRADIYFGDGARARALAGNMRRFGRMYFMAGKNDSAGIGRE